MNVCYDTFETLFLDQSHGCHVLSRW